MNLPSPQDLKDAGLLELIKVSVHVYAPTLLDAMFNFTESGMPHIRDYEGRELDVHLLSLSASATITEVPLVTAVYALDLADMFYPDESWFQFQQYRLPFVELSQTEVEEVWEQYEQDNWAAVVQRGLDRV